MLVRGKYGTSLIHFTGFLAVYILIYSTVSVEGLLPLPPITLVPPSAVEPNPTRPPHGCYNYGLCTNPKKKTITSPEKTVVWDCTHTDCVCVAGIENGNYTCSSKPKLCLPNPCGITNETTHMKCVNGFGTYNCTCKAGWTGSDCNMDMDDPCAEAPCLNGGTCTTFGATYQCSCAPDYSGDQCQFYNYCKNNTCAGTCTQELGDSTWKCTCPSGYQGPDCTKTYAIWVSTNEENLGCFNYDGGLLDSNCKKITSPMNTIDYCKQQQMTTMDPFYNRFAISGQNCYLCNDMLTLPKAGGSPKKDWSCAQQCPGNGGQSCGRDNERVWMYKNTNYIWDSDQCASINGTNPCSQGTGQGICIDDEGAYSCRCHPKYTGNDCETPIDDPCLVAPCLNNGTCIADPNTLNYKCKCLENYHGTNCEHEKRCENTTCDNMGTCYEKDDGNPGCICLTYYTGQFCEAVDRCLYDHPCGINGTCNSNPTSIDPMDYSCKCDPGFTGPTCDDETNECADSPCVNGGTCNDMFLDYNCSCVPGTEGKNCEINPNDCVEEKRGEQTYPNICMVKDSAAECIDGINGFICNCSDQWVGDHCEINKIIQQVLLSIFGEEGSDMTKMEPLIKLLEDLLKNPALIKDMVPFIIGLKNYTERLSHSWNYNDMFDWVAYEDKEIIKEEYTSMWNDVVLGNCFTLNHLFFVPNKTFDYRDIGRNQGLRAKLKINYEEYMPWTDTAGVSVYVHNKHDFVIVESVRYNAEPGGEFVLDIKDVQYTRMGGKYGECISDPNKVDYYYYDKAWGYATEACLRSCYQNMIYTKCQCYDPRYPWPAPADSNISLACELKKRTCVEETIKSAGDPSTWTDCYCPLPCYNQQYLSTWTRSKFVDSTSKCYDSDNVTACKEEYDEKVTVEIRLPKVDYYIYSEIEAMTFNRFVSYLGGLLGILSGIQIITFIEFFVLFWRLFLVAVSNKAYT